MLKPIPYGRQDIDERDIAAVTAALRSDFLTQGPAVEKFEADLVAFCGARHAVAVANATAALHIGCQALGVGPGDLVWTSPNTFVASANCALYLGAQIDFVDIDARTYNLCPDALTRKLEAAKKSGRLPKLVIPVHHSGQPCDMKRIRELSRQYGFSVMEDASHAIGGSYDGQRIGAGEHSDLVVFSFHPVKIMTTGEGGALLTNDPELAARLQRLRSHGITRDPARMTKPVDGPWYYEQIDLGFNYRITDIQAALGSSQLKRVPEFVARREAIALRYDRELASLPLTTPHRPTADGARSALHLYVVRVDRPRVKKSHSRIFEELHARGVMANLHYIPVYLQPHYRKLGFEPGLCPEAERYYAEAISIPVFTRLTEDEQSRVVATLGETLSG